MFMYSCDGAGGTVNSRTTLLQETVQLVLEIWVRQVRLLQIEVSEAEWGGGSQTGGGGQRAPAGRQRASAAARRAGQSAGRQAAGDTWTRGEVVTSQDTKLKTTKGTSWTHDHHLHKADSETVTIEMWTPEHGGIQPFILCSYILKTSCGLKSFLSFEEDDCTRGQPSQRKTSRTRFVAHLWATLSAPFLENEITRNKRPTFWAECAGTRPAEPSPPAL